MLLSKDSAIRGANAQLGALCCNWELSKYQEVESSNLVTDYKHILSPFKLQFSMFYLVQPLANLKYVERSANISIF